MLILVELLILLFFVFVFFCLRVHVFASFGLCV
jgi:hypothetical protein